MKLFRLALTMIIGLGIASPAYSIMIGGVEVGSIDTIVGVTDDLNDGNGCPNGSNPDAEECWAEDVLGGTDLTYSGKEQTVDVMYDGAIAAFALVSGPGHYIVKNAQTWVLLENLADLAWGVLDTSDPLLDDFKLNLGKDDQTTISHVTEFDGTHGVPEPNILALIGIGLLGIGFARRKRRTKI